MRHRETIEDYSLRSTFSSIAVPSSQPRFPFPFRTPKQSQTQAEPNYNELWRDERLETMKHRPEISAVVCQI